VDPEEVESPDRQEDDLMAFAMFGLWADDWTANARIQAWHREQGLPLGMIREGEV
jgi:hypothetical protein